MVSYLGDKFRLFGMNFIYIFSIIILIIIFIINIQYSSLTFSSWYPLIFSNSLLSSFAKILIGVILIILLGVFAKLNKDKNLLRLVIFVNILTLIFRFLIINGFNNTPIADSWSVFNGVNTLFFTNDIQPLYIGNYFSLYPQQLGIVTILYPLALFFRGNINLYYFTQVIMIQFIILLLTLSSYKLKGIKTAFVTTVLMNLFIPNYFISFLIYGDLYALLFLTIAFTLFVFYKNNSNFLKVIFIIIGFLSLVFAYYARLSTNVFIIAIMLTMYLSTKINLKFILKSVLLISVILFPFTILTEFYNVKDVELGKYSFPSNTWLRIGLGYSGFDNTTPGFHDNKTEEEFRINGYDVEKMSEINTQRINNQILSFRDWDFGFNFFKQKTIIMWTDPDFEMMTLIIPFKGSKIDNPKKTFYESNYGSGKIDLKPKNKFGEIITDSYFIVRKYEKVFMFSIFILLIIIFIKSKKDDLFVNFSRLLLIGFFLLHLIIEIKSRYVFVCINALIFFVSLYYLDYFNDYYSKFLLYFHRYSIKEGIKYDSK